MNNSAIDQKEMHERWAKLVGGYTAFVTAVLVTMFAKSNEYPSAKIVISLLALSLPSLVALTLLDFIVRVSQSRKKSMFRGLASFLGFLPSLLAVAILIGHFSVVAAVLFLLLIVFWCLMIYTVAYVGRDQESDV